MYGWDASFGFWGSALFRRKKRKDTRIKGEKIKREFEIYLYIFVTKSSLFHVSLFALAVFLLNMMKFLFSFLIA